MLAIITPDCGIGDDKLKSTPKKPAEIKVRPFITDDARVVGDRLAQLESWVRIDKHAWQHWNLVAYGPNKRVELTTGLVYGIDQPNETGGNHFSYALPLVQAKFLFNEYKPTACQGSGWRLAHFYRVAREPSNR